MNKSFLRILCILTVIAFFSACKKKAYDEYYGRPAGLEPPIYQVLNSKGNFKNLIALIDKAGYKNTLGSAGYWTLFAPNDQAFDQFYKDRNTSIANVDSSAARAIIQYLLVYNAFTKTTIDDYQSSTGLIPDQAFRRRTAFYTGFYNDTLLNGTAVKAIQSNRNGTASPYVNGDNNNKYIPYYTDTYFNGKGITAADYKYLYPSSDFSGFNVAEAKVVTQNIAAENGVIHEIDKVITPLPSIDEYLRSKPEYSEFKRLYDKYMVSFLLNNDATLRYQLISGDNKQVYVKAYSSLLAFSPNSENFLKLQDNDAQANSWTIFVPKNDVLLDYEKKVLLEYYGSFENAPPQMVADFLNAHMWQSPVWPSKFGSTFSFLGEEARFDPQTDIIERKVLSNGFFYGTSKVQEANIFSSVYSRAYLDPKFSIMTRLLDAELKFIVNSPRQKFTLFMMSDAVIRAAGYDYDVTRNEWSYTPPVGTRITGETVRQNLLRILGTSVIQKELTDLSTNGIAEAYNNEYIKWNNNQVISIGLQDANKVALIDSFRVAKNGKVYYLNNLLNFTAVNIGTHIKNLGTATATAADYSHFANFLINSTNYNTGTGEINGVSAGTFYTVFVPSNAAIVQAVKDGVLPGNRTTGAPNFGVTVAHTPAEKEKVNQFIQYHFLNKKTLIPDGKESGAFETLLKNTAGEIVPVTIMNAPGSMQLTDIFGRKANVIVPKSNNLSNRAVIHLIDNYLKF